MQYEKKGAGLFDQPPFLFFPINLYNRARLYNCVFGHNYDPVTDVVVLPFGLHYIFVVANNPSLTDARIFIDDCTIIEELDPIPTFGTDRTWFLSISAGVS